ncbi:TMEM43 family protein [uncultured Roseibium sp.]|uniref:TMEM43 family protein n=1 Tax=uncultured Roseibium sp. TaxID=1936171 RepID=UPI003216FA77
MSARFTETTSRSWFSRITGAFGGIVTGFLLVIVACGALFWNEGRAVKLERTLTEGAGAVVSVDAARPDSANDGRLVHISGPVRVGAPPADPLFSGLALPINTIRLVRHVEMYQWKEESKRETRNKIGGGTQKVTTYSYSRDWSSGPIDSSNFRKPEEHENPDLAVSQNSATSKSAAVGAFQFPGRILAGVGTAETLPANEIPLAGLEQFLGDSFKVQTSAGKIYVGANPAAPAIGDLKITLTASVVDEASVVGMQQDDRLIPYNASNGNEIFLTAAGNKTAADMFETVKSANVTKTWIIRGVGTLAILIGFRLMFSIVGVLGDVIPAIGDVFRFATGLASLALTFVLAPLVMSIAWIVYRPVLGLTILLAGLLISAAFLYIGKSRVSARNTSTSTSSPASPV